MVMCVYLWLTPCKLPTKTQASKEVFRRSDVVVASSTRPLTGVLRPATLGNGGWFHENRVPRFCRIFWAWILRVSFSCWGITTSRVVLMFFFGILQDPGSFFSFLKLRVAQNSWSKNSCLEEWPKSCMHSCPFTLRPYCKESKQKHAIPMLRNLWFTFERPTLGHWKCFRN